MALEITGSLELENGVVVNNSYARTTPRLNANGNTMFIMVDFYVSKNIYLAGKSPLSVVLPIPIPYDYDRDVDGNDVLLVSNQKIKAELEALGYSVVITDI